MKPRHGHGGARAAHLPPAVAGLALPPLPQPTRPQFKAPHSVAPELSSPCEAPLPHLRFVWCLHYGTCERVAPMYWARVGVLPSLINNNRRLVCCSCGEDQRGCCGRGGRAGGDATRVLRRGMRVSLLVCEFHGAGDIVLVCGHQYRC